MNYAFDLIEGRSEAPPSSDGTDLPPSLLDEVVSRPVPLAPSHNFAQHQQRPPLDEPMGCPHPTLQSRRDDEPVELADMSPESDPSNASGHLTIRNNAGAMPDDRLSPAASETKQHADDDDNPDLASARRAFQTSRAGIMGAGPPPGPAPKASALTAVTQQTVFSKLLADHQREMARLQEELSAEKKRTHELKRELERAVADGAGGAVKRKKLGGRLTLP